MENIYFRKEKQMQPTLQILGYLPLMVPSEKRQVTISDGKCRTAYCCNIYKNELFDAAIVEYTIVDQTIQNMQQYPCDIGI